MKIENVHIVYFLGVGGIGMSAIARWFHANGCEVYGYDKTPTALTSELIKEGIKIHFTDEVSAIPAQVKENKETCLVIYTPAIPKDHQEHAWLKAQGYTIMKRSQVLGLITEGSTSIAVAGTHGKTTTSSMVAHVLHHGGIDCAAFLGGIAVNFNSNLVLNQQALAGSLVVVEADEFDRSFLTLHPNIAIVTAADADHLDIYGDKDALTQSFKDFIARLSSKGQLIINQRIVSQLLPNPIPQETITYGIERGDAQAQNITIVNGCFVFDFAWKDIHIQDIALAVPGYHNVENATAAAVSALLSGMAPAQVKSAIGAFAGVKRRFEYIIRSPKIIFIDDYAHHPAEIEAFLKSVRALYPDKKITALFQPHLFTRTRDFAEGFSESLSLADEVLLLDIYPARELPIEGVNAQMLLPEITSSYKELVSKMTALHKMERMDLEVVVTIGAGDIDQLVQPIKNTLMKRYE
ncbi:UDP-N-acetylmuramate--L-alanine ligase [Cytophagales bacterium LB-30]|uniref:UDP-N-acetylmuramate--L-alanine ligase n=1 Tax=Shiella aurantiaca TaxID=3058365 RepID=A0ABT8F2H9_9BACT|nr:UDP-N-acetylmuramate--L-alanine ligase [Shiella aurantiaca]MDN4164424.1 UDP-N-acetylmuramate--L-alanine ligase [Shiella aurantiaca]